MRLRRGRGRGARLVLHVLASEQHHLLQSFCFAACAERLPLRVSTAALMHTADTEAEALGFLVLTCLPTAVTQQANEEGEDEAEDEEEHEEGPDPNSWYRWHEWHVTCCIRPPDKGRRPSSSASEHHHVHGSDPELEEPGYRQLHLAVETCAVQPDIILKTELPEVGGWGRLCAWEGPKRASVGQAQPGQMQPGSGPCQSGAVSDAV